jgi:hypothetical protein
MKKEEYIVIFTGKRYEQLKRLSIKRKSMLYVISKALDLLEKAKNV